MVDRKEYERQRYLKNKDKIKKYCIDNCDTIISHKSIRCHKCNGKLKSKNERIIPEPNAIKGCKWIPLNRGLFSLINEQYFEMISKFTWYAAKSRSTHYAMTRLVLKNEKDIHCALHHFILGYPIHKSKVDHIDGNGLNNCIENLRFASSMQNSMNRKTNKNSKSGYKGVHKNSHNGKNPWRVIITFNKKRINLGSFDDPVDAAKIYDKAALKYFKEFAKLNFPKSNYEEYINSLDLPK